MRKSDFQDQACLKMWMEGEAHTGESKDFNILGTDGLKAREPVTVRTKLG
jgi:hypothetical protein